MRRVWALLLCLALPTTPVMAFTDTIDVATPAGSDDPKQGDDRIRELKRGFRERLAVDHDFALSGDTVDAADIGEHTVVQMQDQGSNPSSGSGKGKAFSKQVSSHSELHWIDDDGTVTQLTSNGALSSAVPTGAIIMMTTTCPSGYTEISSTYAGMLKIGTTATTSAAASTSETPAHTHTGPSHSHTASQSITLACHLAGQTTAQCSTATPVTSDSAVSDVSLTTSSDGTGASGSTGSATFSTLRLCQKN